MCHTVELLGGLADGVTFDLHATPPRYLVVWHDDRADDDIAVGCSPLCEGTQVRDPDDMDGDLGAPLGVPLVTYRRRWDHVHRLHLPEGTVGTLPYDVVRAPAEHQTAR